MIGCERTMMESDAPGKTQNPIPSVLAVLLCDMVISDAFTGKKTLVGLLDILSAADFPVKAPAFTLYARLTDMNGEYAMRFDLVNLEDEQRLASFTAEVQSPPDRLATSELAVQFPEGIRFERPGRYEFQVYADEVFVGRCTLRAERKEASQ